MVRTILVSLLLFPSVLEAQFYEHKIALHLTERGGPTACPSEPEPCSTYPLSGSLGHPYDVYVVASTRDTAGLGGLSFGISYDEIQGSGLDVYSWTLCADGEAPLSGRYGAWPAPRSGNRVVWSDCPRVPNDNDDIHAIAGVFYVYAYSSDMLVLLDDDLPLEMVSCNSSTVTVPEHAAGCIRFPSDQLGYNPCLSPHPHYDPGAWTPTLALHVQESPLSKSCFSVLDSNSDIVTHMETVNPDGTAEYYVYVLAGDKTILESYSFLSGAQWGIEYTPHTGAGVGLEVLEWQSCGIDAPSGPWPATGSGNSVVWDLDTHECHGDRMEGTYSKFTTLGYFRVAVHGHSTFSIAPHPVSGKVRVADCAGYGELGICEAYRPVDMESEGWFVPPSYTGWVGFGSAGAGCNPMLGPCFIAGKARDATWGDMKTKYLN